MFSRYGAGEALWYLDCFEKTDVRFHPSTLLCGVTVDHQKISEVLCLSEEGNYLVQPEGVIDATGNGYVAALCGTPMETGNAQTHMVQNYSQRHRTSDTEYDKAIADQGIMRPDIPSEWTRAIHYNVLHCADYDIHDMLAVRESSRVKGLFIMTHEDAVRGRVEPDALIDCYSTYDTHARSQRLPGRLGVMPEHAKARFVAIPYRTMLVHEAQNLMITGKALSFDQDAFNYTRMPADVMTLAVAAGQIAAQTNDYWHADIKSIQMQMLRVGALIHQPAAETWYENPLQRIVAPLLCGEEAAFADVVLADWPEVLPILQNALAQETMKNREQIARALLWYGDTSCAEEILDAFIQLDQIAGAKPYDDHMPNGLIEAGVRTELDDYWRINQYAVLLAKCNYRRAVPAIAAAMNRTEMGAFYHPELPTYGSLRVDCLTNNHYDRMFSLAEAALLMPDERFVAPLWRLIGMVQSVCFETENPYMHFLTLRLAHVALKCGSLEAMNIIQDYQKNIHGVLREYASGLSSTLSEVTE